MLFVVVFPNCKINLGLAVTGKRTDGFHNIETIFFPVPLKDALEIVPAKNNETSLYSYGSPIAGNPGDNLCTKAYFLLRKDFPEIPAVEIHLLKKIPMGAGLGGGSADGAFMLRLLNDAYKLNLSSNQLINYALQLGSDCPFFIYNEPCYATGRGEVLEPVQLNLSGHTLVLNNPGVHINTGWAFGQLKMEQRTNSYSEFKKIIQEPVREWKEKLTNDFEQPVFEQYPAIAEIKNSFYKQGAVYAAMSGSGSTVFGLFEKNVCKKEALPPHCIMINL
jgi:4-diphosphocytidyl-2-C-methyl-D-erythritol kinase